MIKNNVIKKNVIKKNVIKRNAMETQDFMDLDQDVMDFHQCLDILLVDLINIRKENVNVEK